MATKAPKTPAKKAPAKVAKPAAKAEKTSRATVKSEGLDVSVIAAKGTSEKTMTMPSEYFAAPINKQLMSQAVRVYLANQREGSASTKTRGEVEGSTKKIYKQKGTGNARHGAIRAPIFVGGGIVFGPKPQDHRLDFSAKMKKIALMSALSAQYKEGNIVVVDGLGELEPKTKAVAAVLLKAGMSDNTLLVVGNTDEKVVKAARNISSLHLLPVRLLNTYAVLSHRKIIFMKQAVEALTKTN